MVGGGGAVVVGATVVVVVVDEVVVDAVVVAGAVDVVMATVVGGKAREVLGAVGVAVVDVADVGGTTTGATSGALLPPGRGAAIRNPPTVTTAATATQACHLTAPKNAAGRRTLSSSFETIETPETGGKSPNGRGHHRGGGSGSPGAGPGAAARAASCVQTGHTNPCTTPTGMGT